MLGFTMRDLIIAIIRLCLVFSLVAGAATESRPSNMLQNISLAGTTQIHAGFQMNNQNTAFHFGTIHFQKQKKPFLT